MFLGFLVNSKLAARDQNVYWDTMCTGMVLCFLFLLCPGPVVNKGGVNLII